jgi:hypothetical protein
VLAHLSNSVATSDRLLTTLALLKVNQEEGRTYVDSYLPFVLHCLEGAKTSEVSTVELQKALRGEFGIELPHAVLKRILRRASEDGKVEQQRGVYVVDREKIVGCSLAAAMGEMERGSAQLVDALTEFASTDFEADWNGKKGKAALGDYINGFSSKVLAAAISGGSLHAGDRKRTGDTYIVQRFASMISRRNQNLFDALLTRVKGRMLADAMFYLSESADQPPSLKKVEVYLDGPPLLFILGYAGPEMQAPYAELLSMLAAQTAIVRCFEHSVTEAREILDAAAARANTGGSASSYHGDVVAHLVRSGKSSLDIEMLSNRVEKDLLKLGINPVATPARKPHLQPDEEELAEKLQKALGYGNRLARDRDIDSLTAVHRLREGRQFRELEKCRAIFVTHNFNLFKTSAAFFRRRDKKSIPPCVFDMSLATMLWLREPSSQPNLPEDRIAASAYAAVNPDDRLWAKYNTEIERLRESGQLNEDDAIFLRYDRDAQEALMDETRGDHEAFTEGTIDQVITRARDNLLADTRAERNQAQTEAAAALKTLRVSRDRVKHLARFLGQSVANLGLVIFTSALLLGAIFGPAGPVSRSVVSGPVQVLCAIVFVGLGLASIFFRSSLLDHRRKVALWFERRFASALLWASRL